MINTFQKIQDDVIPISFKEDINSLDKKSIFHLWWYLLVFFLSAKCVRVIPLGPAIMLLCVCACAGCVHKSSLYGIVCIISPCFTHIPCWSEQSACPALRRCSETKCPQYLVSFPSERSACAALGRCCETKCPLYLVLFFSLFAKLSQAPV